MFKCQSESVVADVYSAFALAFKKPAGIPKEAAIVMHGAEEHKMRSWRLLSVARVERRRAAAEDKGSW